MLWTGKLQRPYDEFFSLSIAQIMLVFDGAGMIPKRGGAKDFLSLMSGAGIGVSN